MNRCSTLSTATPVILRKFALLARAIAALLLSGLSLLIAATPLHLPNLDGLKVKDVSIIPEADTTSTGGGQRLMSLDAASNSLSVSVPLPAGGTGSKDGEIVAGPIPFLSPSIGFGISVGGGYLYNPDLAGTNLPPWVTGGGGFYSDNGSWGAPNLMPESLTDGFQNQSTFPLTSWLFAQMKMVG